MNAVKSAALEVEARRADCGAGVADSVVGPGRYQSRGYVGPAAAG